MHVPFWCGLACGLGPGYVVGWAVIRHRFLARLEGLQSKIDELRKEGMEYGAGKDIQMALTATG
jgi:hypothetical protein